jgi:hypothetical protein
MVCRPSGRVMAEVSGWSLRAPWRMVRGLVATVLGTSPRVRRRAPPRPLLRSPRTSRRAPARPLQAVSRYLSTSPRTTPPRGRPRPLGGPATGLPGALHTTTNPRVQRLPTGSLRDPRETPQRPPPTPSQEPSQNTSTRSSEPRGSTRRAPPHPSQRPSDVGEATRRALPAPFAEVSEAPSTSPAQHLCEPSRASSAKHLPPVRGVSEAAWRDSPKSSPRPSTSRATTPQRGPARRRRRPAETPLTRDAVNDTAPPSR